MHLLILQRKTCWTTLEGIFVFLANIARMRRDIVFVFLSNIARMRRDIVQIMC
jgi:hypothetical protein